MVAFFSILVYRGYQMMKKILVVMILFTITLTAQEKETEIQLTGNLNLDSKIAFVEQQDEISQLDVYKENKKSPFLAGALSLAIPGAGEFYTGDYWKTAIFVAVEASAITVAAIYDGKGDDQTSSYENFANQNWSVKQYAQWTVDNATRINANVDPAQYNVFNNDGSVNWHELNDLEGAIGEWFSHRLAPYADQQYYEMIGKYPQFNAGWSDFNESQYSDNHYDYGDQLTEKYLYYSGERGKANDFYNAARWGVIVIVTNHILSAVDAALSAGSYNRKLESQLNIRKQQLGFYSEYYPELSIRLSF